MCMISKILQSSSKAINTGFSFRKLRKFTPCKTLFMQDNDRCIILPTVFFLIPCYYFHIEDDSRFSLLAWSDINSTSGMAVSEGIARSIKCGFCSSVLARLVKYHFFLNCGLPSFGGRLQRKPYQTSLRISRYPSRKRSFLMTKMMGLIEELQNPHQYAATPRP